MKVNIMISYRHANVEDALFLEKDAIMNFFKTL